MLKIKRFIAGLLTVVFILSMHIVSAQGQMTFTLSTASSKQGESATLSLTLNNNSGVAAVYLTVGYDVSSFELVSVSDKGILEDFDYNDNNGKIVLSWEPATYNNTENGVIAELTFKAKATAGLGEKSFSLTTVENGVLNKDALVVECTSIGGSISIISDSPVSVTSSVLNVDEATGYISKISCLSTVGSIFEKIDQQNVKIFSGATLLSSDSLVGTGMILKLFNGEQIVREYTLIVTGDCSGDGKINIADMVATKAKILGKSSYSEIYLTAMDNDGNGKINIADFINSKAHILGKGNITGISHIKKVTQ